MAHNLIGIDYGAQRVGLAVSVDGAPPHRLMTLPNNEHLMAALQEQVNVQAAEVAVVGLPRNLDGDDTAQTATVRAFADRLRTACSGVAVYLQDEALTSETARTRLGNEVGSRASGHVDQEAAVIILEDYIRGTATS